MRSAPISRRRSAICCKRSSKSYCAWRGQGRRVRIVTDHGWLLMPGGLPQAELVAGLTVAGGKGHRVATLKEGAPTSYPRLPWSWDKGVLLATATGARAFYTRRRIRAWRGKPAGMHPAGPRHHGRGRGGAGCHQTDLAAAAAQGRGARRGRVDVRRAPGRRSFRAQHPAEGRSPLGRSRAGQRLDLRRIQGKEVFSRRASAECAAGYPRSAGRRSSKADGEVIELDDLDRKATAAFPGHMVRKDLVRQFRGQFPVPTYVVEFMLGRYCASTDPAEIDEGRRDGARATDGAHRAGRRGGIVQGAGARARLGADDRHHHRAPRSAHRQLSRDLAEPAAQRRADRRPPRQRARADADRRLLHRGRSRLRRGDRAGEGRPAVRGALAARDPALDARHSRQDRRGPAGA